MSKGIYIDCAGGNIIACLSDDDRLLEFQMEKRYSRVIVGSIYRGRVENVLNGMQAAFVNIGLEKNAYLYTGDVLVDKNDIDCANIPTSLNLQIGDEVMVQVVKDASGTKGCRLTTHVSFAGRNLVYMPTLNISGISRKISDVDLRNKLAEMMSEIKTEEGGFIVRTAAQLSSKDELINEAKYLISRYNEIKLSFSDASSGAVLYEEGDLARRYLRDVYTHDIEKIVVSDRQLYDEVLVDAKRRGNGISEKIVFHDKPTDIFSAYGLREEIDKMLRNKVFLSSGAYLIIDKTEALTAIDVNTGKYTGDRNLETTVFETNVLAAKEIARQLRLRNISGIIIVDFIDMDSEEHRQEVIETLKTALKEDRTKCNVVGMTELGLVEITRKKSRRESTSTLVKKCPYCKGEGVIFSNDYIVMKIRVALLDVFSNGFSSAIIDVNVEIADYILTTGSLSKDVRKIWRQKRIYLIPHKTYHQEFFVIKGDNSVVLDLPDQAKQLF